MKREHKKGFKVNLGDVVPVSTVEWYGKASMVIFLRGCPFRCPYCQNYAILEGDNFVDIEYLEGQIKKAKNFIDAVVFSGGEPLMQPEQIKRLAGFTKMQSLLVGIETNGYYPEHLKELIGTKLVDKIFIDVKAPLFSPKLYGKVTGADGKKAVTQVKKSLEICRDHNLEIRTTVFRGLICDKNDIKAIAEEVSSYGKNIPYVLQQGRPEQGRSEELKQYDAPDRDELLELGRMAKRYLRDVRIRTKEFGEELI
ncbi:MAG: anaerobic ribonucleoside-triphosphate reductase activating protein [Methanosarcinales archaeon Met12]|nr:MAG: anaerobic ribonucleoside-triphosphate reductase activating protein [Methanosarcinales archaeon Met12]